jgi:hypothetical protein
MENKDNHLFSPIHSERPVGVDYWMQGWDDLTINGVAASSIFIVGMKRKTEGGDLVYLPDGGEVKETDLAILVTVLNPTSYFLNLVLKENPTQGSDLLLPRNLSFEKDKENEIVVFPGIKVYEFTLLHQGGVGEVIFELYDQRGSVVDTKNAFIKNCCRSERCPDSKSGWWSGGIIGWELAKVGYLSKGWGQLTPLPYSTIIEEIRITCVGLGPSWSKWYNIYASGGVTFIACKNAPCFEDLEGVSVGGGGGFGGGFVGGVAGIGYVGGPWCFEFGGGFGIGYYGAAKTCVLQSIYTNY